MNKYAAQKIAQEYHSLGIKLAFEQAGIKVSAPKQMDKKYRLGSEAEEAAYTETLGDAGISIVPFDPSKAPRGDDGRKAIADKYDVPVSEMDKKILPLMNRQMNFHAGLQRGGDPVTAFNLPGKGYNPHKKSGPYKN